MTIERVTEADAEELLAIYTPYVTDTAITFEYEVPTVSEFAARIRSISAKYPYLKAVENGEIVGYAYAGVFKGRAAYDWAVETTIYIRKDCRRAGFGKQLYEALEKSLKGMGILNLNACIAYTENPDEHLTNDSVHFHEHLGYQRVGVFHQCGLKFGTWYDMTWMEKIIGEHKGDAEPVRFGEWTV